MHKLVRERTEGRLRLTARHAGELGVQIPPPPAKEASQEVSFGKGSAAAEGAFGPLGGGKGWAKDPHREFEGSGAGGRGMDGGGWFNAQTQGVSNAHGATAQPVQREAARSGASGGVYGLGRGAQTGARARESAPGQEAPAGQGGGRLTLAAERLHGEDAPPAQHGPAPGPDAAPRPRPQQPARDPGQRPPAAVWRAASHARPAPAGRGPRTLPAGGEGEGAGVGEGRAGVRAAGGGGRARRGRGGPGAGAGSRAAPGAPGSREKASIRCLSDSGQPRAPAPGGGAETPAWGRCVAGGAGLPGTPHYPFTCCSVFLPPKCSQGWGWKVGGDWTGARKEMEPHVLAAGRAQTGTMLSQRSQPCAWGKSLSHSKT